MTVESHLGRRGPILSEYQPDKRQTLVRRGDTDAGSFRAVKGSLRKRVTFQHGLKMKYALRMAVLYGSER